MTWEDQKRKNEKVEKEKVENGSLKAKNKMLKLDRLKNDWIHWMDFFEDQTKKIEKCMDPIFKNGKSSRMLVYQNIMLVYQCGSLVYQFGKLVYQLVS